MAPSQTTASPTRNHPAPCRTIERQSSSSRRRRSTVKPKDSLELLAVVVTTPRHSSKFMCPLCASTFGRRCELKRHVAEVHTLNGARRFACKHPACGKSFTRKDALAKHEIVKHQGKRRFICATCSEKFTSRYDLTRHNIRVHSNVKKRFNCEYCGAGFSQKSQLTMHKGRVHSQVNTPDMSTSSSISPSVKTPESYASMDSLAAVAVAMAKQEEKLASSRPAGEPSPSGTPTHQRVAVASITTAKRTTPREEAEAAAFAADTLLEAAAVLQPKTTESSFATHVTDDLISIIGDHTDTSEVQDTYNPCTKISSSVTVP